jgi:hypothetical protein
MMFRPYSVHVIFVGYKTKTSTVAVFVIVNLKDNISYVICGNIYDLSSYEVSYS